MNSRPFSPETLAERWGCSAHHVRNMMKAGQISGFRLGKKLMRIPADEVDRFEREQALGGAADAKAAPGDAIINPDWPGKTLKELRFERRLARMRVARGTGKEEKR